MTPKEINEINWDWEAEEKRLKAMHRRRYAREHAWNAFLVAVGIGLVVFLYFWNKWQPLRERAAYEAGRAAAEQKAAEAGGWDALCERLVAEVGR